MEKRGYSEGYPNMGTFSWLLAVCFFSNDFTLFWQYICSAPCKTNKKFFWNLKMLRRTIGSKSGAKPTKRHYSSIIDIIL